MFQTPFTVRLYDAACPQPAIEMSNSLGRFGFRRSDSGKSGLGAEIKRPGDGSIHPTVNPLNSSNPGTQDPRAAPWRDRHALAYGNQNWGGILARHNCQFATRDGTRRVPAVLRGMAALLHFVATGKNRSGKAFDGQ
jgi:hypothetical protein